jgi:hypothetical protein
MQGEAERALHGRPPSLPNRPHFDADSIDSAIPRPSATLSAVFLLAAAQSFGTTSLIWRLVMDGKRPDCILNEIIVDLDFGFLEVNLAKHSCSQRLT